MHRALFPREPAPHIAPVVLARRSALRGERLAIAALFTFALALRLAHLQQIRAHDPYFAIPSIDEVSYRAWALAIAAGDWIGHEVFYLGPLYPYVLAPFYALFGPDPLVPKLLHAVLGGVTSVLLFLLGRALFDSRVGFVAGAITAAYEMLIFMSGHLLLENVLVPLGVVLVLLAVRALRVPTLGRWASAGAAAGLAALARENLLLYGPGLVAWMLVALRDRLGLRARLVRALVFALAVAAFVAPVSLRNSWLDGGFVLTNHTGGIVLFTAWHPDATGTYSVPSFLPPDRTGTPEEQRVAYARVAEEALGVAPGAARPSEVSAYWTQRALAEIVADPARTGRLLARKLDLLLNAGEVWDIRPIELAEPFSAVLRLPLPVFGVVAPLALAGMVLSARRFRDLVPVYGLLAVVLVTGLVFTVLARYRLVAVPPLALFAAVALVGAVDALRARRWRELLLVAAVALAAAGLVNRPIRDDDLSMGHFNLANKYVELERWSEAIEHFERAAALRPTRISFQNNLALAYERAGRRAQARPVWERVRALGLEQGRPPYVERATRYLRAGDAGPQGGP